MKKTLILAFFSVIALSACDKKKAEDSKEIAEERNEAKFEDSKMDKDAEWGVAIADGGMLEVKLGELAQTNASSALVKDFGMMMIKDHSKANSEFEKLAEQYNISLPTMLSDKSQKIYDDLLAKKGADFDKAYINGMEDDHEEDIKMFEDESENGKNADLKAFATNTLPTLKHHLQMVKDIKEKMK